MILRKPYAFLIKNFRLIHVVLVLLSIYILNKSGDIYYFFTEYISNGYNAIITENFSSNFINGFLIFGIFLTISVLSAVAILLGYKKKREKMYFISIGFYIILFIYFLIYISIFSNMEKEMISADTARIYRDVSLLFYVPQFALVIFYAVRALGFNVKQFNFSLDLKEMDLASDDNEEIELNVEFDIYKTERSLRRFIREMKYYIYENLIYFIIISIVLVFALIYNIMSNLSFFNDYNYKMNTSFMYDGFAITIEDADISNVDYGGNTLVNDYYVLSLTVKVENTTTKDKLIDINDFKINTGKDYISPSNELSNRFIDYGATLLHTTIKNNSKGTYVITYIIPEKQINNNFVMKIYTDSYEKNGVTYPIYTNINLETEVLNFNKVLIDYNLGDTIKFDNTNIGNTTIKIRDYDIQNIFYYKYEKCINNKCEDYNGTIYNNYSSTTSGKTIMKIESELALDKETYYYLNNKSEYSFFDNFVDVEYMVNGELVRSSVTAFSIATNDGSYYVLVPEAVKYSEKINLIINIRNREYTIKLK